MAAEAEAEAEAMLLAVEEEGLIFSVTKHRLDAWPVKQDKDLDQEAISRLLIP